jgi:hypothetical protein
MPNGRRKDLRRFEWCRLNRLQAGLVKFHRHSLFFFERRERSLCRLPLGRLIEALIHCRNTKTKHRSCRKAKVISMKQPSLCGISEGMIFQRFRLLTLSSLTRAGSRPVGSGRTPVGPVGEGISRSELMLFSFLIPSQCICCQHTSLWKRTSRQTQP